MTPVVKGGGKNARKREKNERAITWTRLGGRRSSTSIRYQEGQNNRIGDITRIKEGEKEEGRLSRVQQAIEGSDTFYLSIRRAGTKRRKKKNGTPVSWNASGERRFATCARHTSPEFLLFDYTSSKREEALRKKVADVVLLEPGERKEKRKKKRRKKRPLHSARASCAGGGSEALSISNQNEKRKEGARKERGEAPTSSHLALKEGKRGGKSSVGERSRVDSCEAKEGGRKGSNSEYADSPSCARGKEEGGRENVYHRGERV